MAAWWVGRTLLRRLCSTEAAAPVKDTRWERLKKSKAGVWLRSVASDYSEACREVVVGAWARPGRAAVYLALLGGAGACAYTNPDSASFPAAVLDRANQLGLLSPWIRSGASDGHVQKLARLGNEGRLRHLSLGVASLAYSAEYDPAACLYEASCGSLAPPWRAFPERVLDVGFAGRWWLLEARMRDYDINDEEFKHLPVAMAATAAPGVQQVERNEALHKASWLPLVVEEEEAAQAGGVEGQGESGERPLGEEEGAAPAGGVEGQGESGERPLMVEEETVMAGGVEGQEESGAEVQLTAPSAEPVIGGPSVG